MDGGLAAEKIDVTALGASACDAFPWRTRGRLFVTVVVKATFEMIPDAPMAVLPPEPILLTEIHHHNNPMRSVRRTPDRAPYLPRADVVLTGYARGLGGAPLDTGVVRLMLFRARPILDKSIRIQGRPRTAEEPGVASVALIYENAYGGLGKSVNPFGSASPLLVDPSDPTQVACFAPMARGWPLRARLLGGLNRKVLDQPIPEFPTEFDWSYFNVAPLDQRVDRLSGDEWVSLYGVHHDFSGVRSCLPRACGQARVHGLSGSADGTPLRLTLDTLSIDGDSLSCIAVWRGNFAVESESELSRLRVVGGVDVGDELVAWTTPPEARGPAPGPAARPSLDRTVDLTPQQQDDAAARGVAIPFAKINVGSSPALGPATQRTAIPLIRSDSATVEIGDVPDLPSTPFFRAPKTMPPPLAPAPAEPVAFDPESTREPERPKPKSSGLPATALGIRLSNETPLALDVIPWKLVPSRDCLTVIAKATCDLVPNDRAVLRPHAEPIDHDLMHGASCVHPSDRVPFKVRADVVAIGEAYAKRPGAALAGQVRGASAANTLPVETSLRFGHEGNAFERRILVHGDRRWTRARAGVKPSVAEPFARMPLTYERAFGGPGFEPNPVGMGRADAMRPRHLPALPNLEDPARLLRTPKQAPPPACFAPLPLAWKRRWAKLGRARDAWPCFPEEHDWTLFQAAPFAQRLAFLRGDEPFSIAGMHPEHDPLEGALPGILAQCFVVWEAGSRPEARAIEEVTLELDTAVFQMNALTLNLVWRGTIPVADEDKSGIAAAYLFIEDLSAPRMDLAQARTRILGHR